MWIEQFDRLGKDYCWRLTDKMIPKAEQYLQVTSIEKKKKSRIYKRFPSLEDKHEIKRTGC